MRKVEYNGRLVEVEVVDFETNAPEQWSTYTLEDGTKAKFRVSVSEFMRVVGEYNASGEPVYLFNSVMQLTTRAKDHLLRPPEVTGKIQ